MGQELLTLCQAVDYLLLGKPAGAADILCQHTGALAGSWSWYDLTRFQLPKAVKHLARQGELVKKSVFEVFCQKPQGRRAVMAPTVARIGKGSLLEKENLRKEAKVVVEMAVDAMTPRMPQRSDVGKGEELLPKVNFFSRQKSGILEDGYVDGAAYADGSVAASGSRMDVAGVTDEWQQVAKSITLSDVESYVDQARRAAEEAQGSGLPETEGSSQQPAWNLEEEREGSLGKTEYPSQMKLDGSGCKVSACSCSPPQQHAWCAELEPGLAVLITSHEKAAERPWCAELEPEASTILREPLGDVNFSQLFSVKGVDYQGEEIRLARRVDWDSIEASLPEHVGKLDLRDFCEGGVLRYVNHFEDYLLPVQDQTIGKPPRVFVDDDCWEPLARGLLDRGICVRRRMSELHRVGQKPLLNGLFSVSKGKFKGSIELCRLIMNLKPINLLTRPLQGDTCTLPMVTQMAAMYLDEGGLLVTSSEDLRCYFYLFAVPEAWFKYLGFGKVLPRAMIPLEELSDDWVLCSRVLPMRFLNSVAVAQHIHRNVVRRCLGSLHPPVGAEGELRRDRAFSQEGELYRVYLDNFDELKKLDRRTYDLIGGSASEVVTQPRDSYASAGLPTHPWIDGQAGTMSAKPGKVAKYVRLALEVLRLGAASQKELQVASQKELQVVCGGLVYVAMFKRPLLGALNQVWQAIVGLDGLPRNQRFPLKRVVMAELVRFLGLVPLAVTTFRPPFDGAVTASDASMTGGGFCVSRGYGVATALSPVRGDIPEAHDFCQILSIGLFDGIGALRVALGLLQAPLAGHISVEANSSARGGG